MTSVLSAETNQSPLVKQKERNYWFDNAKAILIISVVVGHLTNGIFSTSTWWIVAIKRFIFIYHMPVFMAISGRFAKRRIDTGDWISVINKMIVPYLVAESVMIILASALGMDGVSSFTYLKPLHGLWYLLTVAVYVLISPYLVKHKWIFPAAMAVGLLVGFVPNNLYGGLYRVFTYYPYFLFGYFTSGVKFDFCKKTWFRILSVAVIVLTIYVVFNNYTEISHELLAMNKNYKYIANSLGIRRRYVFLENIARYAAGFAYFFIILGISPVKKTFFSYVGTYSSYVYVLHLFLIVVILRGVDAKLDILSVLTTEYLRIAYVFSGVPLSFILASKPVRKLTRFIIEPNFDIRRIVKKLVESD